MIVTSFDQKLPFKVDGGSGLKLTLPIKSLNPHLSIPNVLPPIASAGRYRITCSYYLPKENRNLKGFYFLQDYDARIENYEFKIQGKWVTKILSSLSLNDDHYCRLSLSVASGKKLIAAAGESIILGELKIEQTAFSAYVHSRYNVNRQISESFPQAADQKKLVSAGTFISS